MSIGSPNKFKRSGSTVVDVNDIPQFDNPSGLYKAASDPLVDKADVEPSFEVRTCSVQDTKRIVSLMRTAWPDEPEWRNPQYWAKQFLTPNSQRYGFVIEEIGINTGNINNNSPVIGFAMYKWLKPKKAVNIWNGFQYGYDWYQNDFNTNKFEWNDGFNQQLTTIVYDINVYNNKNLKDNWFKLTDYVVHITDVAIHPSFRGKGLGTQLMQTLIYSFPSFTRFALEVKCANIGGIKCYKKCGFVIKRKLQHYYGRNHPAFKMSLISNYINDDVTNFIQITQLKRSKKHKENIEKTLKQFHIQSKITNNNNDNDDDVKNDINDNVIDDDDDYNDVVMNNNDFNQSDKIKNALQKLCGNDWQFYFNRFRNQELCDTDLISLTEDDLKDLIPKIGPRSRIRNWIKTLQNK